MTLWFEEGAEDLPYIDLEDWCRLITLFATDEGAKPGYELNLEPMSDGHTVMATRETQTTAYFDFEDDVISFTDYVAFIKTPERPYLGIAAFSSMESGEEPYLLATTGSRVRTGDVTILNLKDYDIPMIAQNGKHLIPLQTLSALFLTPYAYGTYFNGEAVFIVQIEAMANPLDILERALKDPDVMTPETQAALDAFDGTEEDKPAFLLDLIARSSEAGAKAALSFIEAMETGLYPVYASVPTAPRSEALALYGYHELCFELDCMYSLKDSHNIKSFDLFFLQTGLAIDLLDRNADKADQAIMNLVQYWLDDLHSSFTSVSYLTEKNPIAPMGTATSAGSRRQTCSARRGGSIPTRSSRTLKWETLRISPSMSSMRSLQIHPEAFPTIMS